VLRKHQPDHILLRATRAEAAHGLTDVSRIATLLARVQGRIRHRRLDKVSPLAVPALIEQGREWVEGGAEEALLAEAAALVDEATDGAERFADTLADITDGVTLRGEPGQGRARSQRGARTPAPDTPAARLARARQADPRRARFIRQASLPFGKPER